MKLRSPIPTRTALWQRQPSVWGALTVQALVGFLTLVLLVVMSLSFLREQPTDAVLQWQQRLAAGFQVAPPDPPNDAATPDETDDKWVLLSQVPGVTVSREPEGVTIQIESDVLFFPDSADITDSARLWWPRLVDVMPSLAPPLTLRYERARSDWTSIATERSMVAEQAAMLVRLLAAQSIMLTRFDWVDTWSSPQVTEEAATGNADVPAVQRPGDWVLKAGLPRHRPD
ncbi:MAG: hypothetical protein ACX931_01310 [Saccharospirillum sp.]